MLYCVYVRLCVCVFVCVYVCLHMRNINITLLYFSKAFEIYILNYLYYIYLYSTELYIYINSHRCKQIIIINKCIFINIIKIKNILIFNKY